MAYSLLAHLYPRIKGSQEDVATFSLGYILEQSDALNKAFTKLIGDKLELELSETLLYTCQDADSEHGRPDIAGYKDGVLKILCEAKFYAGLTDNQPTSYLERLKNESGDGLVFICPENRIVSLWDKVCKIAEEHFKGTTINKYCVKYDHVRMTIISWQEILAALSVYASEHDPEKLGDVKQLGGLCSMMESAAFVPFRPEDFGAEVARNIGRYYKAFEAIYNHLKANKDIETDIKNFRLGPYISGYARYIVINGILVSLNYNQDLWKADSSIETPYWIFIQELNDSSKGVTTEKVNRFMATIDSRKRGWFYQNDHIALEPKPYLELEEFAEDMANQIVQIVHAFQKFQ